MKLSKHFDREEFACKDGCGFSTVDAELLKLLEIVREHFNRPIIINSACRCEDHNKAVGGKTHSKHLLGIAADIVIVGVPPIIIAEFIDKHEPLKYGIGVYGGFVHVDVRSKKARW
jgi:uncharacterized protein YcbK (DUF882 family)